MRLSEIRKLLRGLVFPIVWAWRAYQIEGGGWAAFAVAHCVWSVIAFCVVGMPMDLHTVGGGWVKWAVLAAVAPVVLMTFNGWVLQIRDRRKFKELAKERRRIANEQKSAQMERTLGI